MRQASISHRCLAQEEDQAEEIDTRPMSLPNSLLEGLSLLYEQHHFYTTELSQAHHVLDKLYKKLARAEGILTARRERKISRIDKKKWQYTCIVSKRAITHVESQKATLHEVLHECARRIASLEHSIRMPLQSPCMAHTPPSPYLFTTYNPMALQAWDPEPHGGVTDTRQRNGPHYWDLSMLHEQGQFSFYTSPTGSDLYGPAAQDLHGWSIDTENHLSTHKAMSTGYDNVSLDSTDPLAKLFALPKGGYRLACVETEDLSQISTPSSYVHEGASIHSSQHRRCYSDEFALSKAHRHAPPLRRRAASIGSLHEQKVDGVQIESEQT